MNRGGTIVGALACQRDSYLQTLRTTVLHCTPVEVKADDKKAKKKKGKAPAEAAVEEIIKPLYEIELEDTVLFPEGGGQPSDRGYLVLDGESEKKIEVIDVQRKNLRAIHIVEEPIPETSSVKIEVNWRRRLDHMQQHTGQHLLSAILDKWGLPTLSWNMGDKINYIEIPRKLTPEELDKVSEEVNDEILNNTKISVEKPVTESTEEVVNEEKGILRIVKIGELDKNPCCGTHLSSVGQIKAISLLGQIKGKGTNSRLNFISGDRVYKYTSELYEMSKKLMNTLSSTFEDLDDKADALTKQTKKLQHREKTLAKEVATLKGEELLREIATHPDEKVFYLLREDGDLEFLNGVYNVIKESTLATDVAVVLIGGCDSSVVVCAGDTTTTENAVASLRQRAGGAAQLRGGVNKGTGRFQGKAGVAVGMLVPPHVTMQ